MDYLHTRGKKEEEEVFDEEIYDMV